MASTRTRGLDASGCRASPGTGTPPSLVNTLRVVELRREGPAAGTLTRRGPVSVQTCTHEPSFLLFGKVAPGVPEVQSLSPPAPLVVYASVYL